MIIHDTQLEVEVHPLELEVLYFQIHPSYFEATSTTGQVSETYLPTPNQMQERMCVTIPMVTSILHMVKAGGGWKELDLSWAKEG